MKQLLNTLRIRVIIDWVFLVSISVLGWLYYSTSQELDIAQKIIQQQADEIMSLRIRIDPSCEQVRNENEMLKELVQHVWTKGQEVQ